MSRMRAVIAAGAIAGSMLTGGVVGAALTGLTTVSANAATATPSASTGTFKPNEDPTHEAGESAAREAQEDAGQVPNVP